MGIFDIQYQLQQYGILSGWYLPYPWGIGDVNYPAFPGEYWTCGVWDIQHHILMTMRVFDANYASWIWRDWTSNTPHGGMDFTSNISYIHKGYEILNILHIQRDIEYPKSHGPIWRYLISNIKYNSMGYCMPDICHIHGGYGISIILHSQGHIGPGGMGYPISHLNDYWSFNNSHIHSGILYIQYPLWRFGVSDIQYHSCPWRILDTQTPRHP